MKSPRTRRVVARRSLSARDEQRLEKYDNKRKEWAEDMRSEVRDLIKKFCSSRREFVRFSSAVRSEGHIIFPPSQIYPRDEARQFLLDLLYDGEVSTKKIIREGKKQGLSYATLRRAGIDLGLGEPRITGFGKDRKSYWRLT